MLSDTQYNLLTSQNNEIKGISEQRARIIEKADKMMITLGIIITSDNIDQQYKDELFPKQKVSRLIHSLISYDQEATAIQESNKQGIALELMKESIKYFRERYKEIFILRITREFDTFAKDITELTEKQIQETKVQELIKTRKTLTPPLLYPSEKTWKAVCLECHKYEEMVKNEDEEIKKIRHTRNCSIHKEMKRVGKDEKETIAENH